MCLEGGCGACIVTLTGRHPVSGDINTWAVNSVCKDDRQSIYSLRILIFFFLYSAGMYSACGLSIRVMA